MAITPAARSLNHFRHDMTPAIAILKGECPRGESLTFLVAQMFADKGISNAATLYLSQRLSFLGHLIGHLLMQAPEPFEIAPQLHGLQDAPLPEPFYTGSMAENRKIDEAIHRSQVEAPAKGMRSSTWTGAAGSYYGGGISVPAEMRDVGTVIIGGGAAGVLVARAL